MGKKLTVNSIKKRIRSVLKTHGIIRAGLFGSAAREELRHDSDIDLLVETNGKIGLLEFVGLKHTLEDLLGRDVDLVEYRALKPALRKQILRDHIQVLV